MKQDKVKKCKYPKCTKETHSKKSLFCLEHSRDLKEKGGKTLAVVSLITPIGIGLITKSSGNKK